MYVYVKLLSKILLFTIESRNLCILLEDGLCRTNNRLEAIKVLKAIKDPNLQLASKYEIIKKYNY
jgi:hypothetical protein